MANVTFWKESRSVLLGSILLLLVGCSAKESGQQSLLGSEHGRLGVEVSDQSERCYLKRGEQQAIESLLVDSTGDIRVTNTWLDKHLIRMACH